MAARCALLGGTPVRTRPFPPWPQSDGRDLAFVQSVLETSQWGGTIHGPRVTAFCETWADYCDAKFSVGMTSCTAGLELALRAFDIGPGDEVIVPAYTFIATAQAVFAVGADVAFVDIDRETYCMTTEALEAAVTPRTRAVIPVHFAGHSADVDALTGRARKHGLKVIWDAAHAHTTEYRGKKVGGFSDLAVYSFNHAKNLTCGEGGMVTTDDDGLAELLKYSLSTFGRKKGRPWYEHHQLGLSHPLTEFQGAILQAQFERLEEQSLKREENARLLSRGLSEVDGVEPPQMASYATRHGLHIYPVQYRSEAFAGLTKASFLEALEAEGVPTGGYNQPIYSNPMFDHASGSVAGARARFRTLPCPVTDWACDEGVFAFSQSQLLDEPDGMDDIVEAISRVKASAGELVDRER